MDEPVAPSHALMANGCAWVLSRKRAQSKRRGQRAWWASATKPAQRVGSVIGQASTGCGLSAVVGVDSVPGGGVMGMSHASGLSDR